MSIHIGNNESKPAIIHINNVNPAGDYERTLKCIWPKQYYLYNDRVQSDPGKPGKSAYFEKTQGKPGKLRGKIEN